MIDETELPDWLMKEDDEVDRWAYEDPDESALGRGTRQRKEVDYTDSLTEKEWLKAIDEGDFEEEDEEEEKVKKRKGRKRRKRDDSDSEVGTSSSKKRKGQSSMDSELKKQMRKLMNIVMKFTDSDGRLLSEPFMKVPARKDYPDYYEIIKKPIDITKIFNRIEESKVRHLSMFWYKKNHLHELFYGKFMFFFQYEDMADLERDFMQLCHNAQMYNEEASLIYEDSIVLQSLFTNAKQRLETDGGGADSDGPDDNDGNKSDADSSVKMKIKIKNKKTPGRRKRSAKKYISDDDDDDDD